MNIELSHLRKQFGEKVAVDIDSFTIHNGDLLGLVGNNGAGKSTLFRLLLDLLKADNGTVTMYFDDLTVNPALSEQWKEHTGSYLDESFLIDFLTPEEFLDFIGKVNGLPPINWQQIYEELDALENHCANDNVEEMPVSNPERNNQNPDGATALENTSLRLHLLKFATKEIFAQKKLIRDFSAGNKQKIGIISALYTRPQLVILDEPFNFLDPSSQHQLNRLLSYYHQSTNATILVSSHNLQHTVDISNRVALMEDGHIIRDLDNTNGQAIDVLTDYFGK